MDCGASFSKYLLFLFNFVFFLSGIAVLTVGSVIKANEDDYIELIGTNLFAICILLIVIGILVTIIGFFGCCGAIRESKCMLYTYSGLLCLIFVMEFAGGIAAFVYRDDIKTMAADNLNKTMYDYPNTDSTKNQWDEMQDKLDCCGVNSPDDWLPVKLMVEGKPGVPASCCKDGVTCTDPTPANNENLNTKGCLDAVIDEIDYYAVIIGGVAIGIAFIQILGIILACCLASAIKD